MATERGLDRVVFFTDAVVAIAITLLILPLVDAVPESSAAGDSVGTYLYGNLGKVLGFAISFVVIARLWRAHHGIFRHVRAYTPAMVNLSLVWAFTIAVLPLPTAIISEFDHVGRVGMALYIGTMTVSSLTLSIVAVMVSRLPGVQEPSDPLSRGALADSIATSALFVVVLVLGLITLSYWTFFLLFLAPLVSRVVQRVVYRGATAPVDTETE